MHLHINFLLYCLENNIDLSNQWIPRALNTQSDFTSKIKDCDDWQITCDFFKNYMPLGSTHIGLFRVLLHKQRFWTVFLPFLEPRLRGCRCIFFQQLTGENCLVVPPVNITTSYPGLAAN